MSGERAAETIVDSVDVHGLTVPTDGPGGVEQDGTLEWDSTTMILVRVHAGGRVGIGYTYGDRSVATFVDSKLVPLVLGANVDAPPMLWERMFAAIRNAGRSGVGAMAVAAVDMAVWDLSARLRRLPLFRALPAFRDEVPVYGSGGFTNYPVDRLADQLAGWVAEGIPRVKLKTSRQPRQDPRRLSAVRAALGVGPELFVDANGALTRKQALYWARRFADEWGVGWLEEPVTSDDREGLRLLRQNGPLGLDIAAGEYGFVLHDFDDLLSAGAVDCLQADVTRCGGVTGLLQLGGLAASHQIDVSAHCAPAASAHAFCAVPRLRHLEYFHDHVRIEHRVFDGNLPVIEGALRPDPDRAGLGLEVRWPDVEQYRVYGNTTSHR
ncbi:L-alanine-DL-glutamate epimerase-like enolase superfamily enzyme [Saccharopolyspora lacisalsi]|uniref:L-alanine-DL-glutamate epimerase-like enolase superfamily enzyme n=1 Tax=Halosaccharopolyspora lacisalsi TaxID=1000566 RepID=A0A839E3F5_9PSEU|nr:enolase C-terminal domain-like protein [Halosaccharopolyspora lacisalsi]MBA8825921.1 L-alanine-DL-glutamate epimerase-like enolase superfamily enzyme [Halosaccharopolyspora lacisalsi]